MREITDTPAGLAHPRGRWLDPSSGAVLDQAGLMQELARQDVVLLGETHTVAEIHRWQLAVTTYLHLLRPDLAVGFEMFPRAVQPVLDRWVAGELDTAAFLAEVDWNTHWGFDPELYLPLFHFCRQQRVPMIALNCRRALVTEVGRDGWEAIPADMRDGLTPSAPATPAYREHLFNLTGGAARMRGTGAETADDPRFDRFVRAQQCWDRAFACNIAHYRRVNGGVPLVIGIIGRGHLEYGYGTPYQLADLGESRSSVLLPTDAATHEPATIRGICRAVFRLDTPEPPSTFRAARPPAA